ncbi:uncharacterized protein BXZ73DRAFT_79635 [Epithele typhae]|uniref:uncharacterized protein n=1 Tax=Epithele typhae TaxID=378194 RepID=UPI002007D94D|nr:uncharacterized protein BXZ73DRAFT_79635 [Epithele typhae]KAH9922806.1 hypothetical protein BXZ73DRAFT_79635 [Epithele typhae]
MAFNLGTRLQASSRLIALHCQQGCAPSSPPAARHRTVRGNQVDGSRSWEQMWHADGLQLKKAGLAVRDRRYILRCMSKYREGMEPAEFAHPPKPPKKLRGRGPVVQNGKRLRHSRDKKAARR